VVDFLNKFTKAELITYIRQNIHWICRPPRKSDLLHIRWEMRSNELEKANKLHIAALEKIAPGDIKARLEWFNAGSKITAGYAALNRLSALISEARQKEREAV